MHMVPEVILEKFQGPLDLLLQLIEQEQLNISEISISKVTEHYFKHLEKIEHKQPEELADFLVIATKLVYLKSKQLLPYLQPEVEEGPSLAEQLKLYKRYAEASVFVAELWQKGVVAYARVEPVHISHEFFPPQNATVLNLHTTMALVINRLKPLRPLPQVTIDHSVSVKQQVENLYRTLQELKKFYFSDILKNSRNRTEVIVNFLAVLELVKQSRVTIEQGEAFDDMEIQRA